MPPTVSTLRTSSTLQRQLKQQFGHIKNSAKKLATSCASPTSRYKTTPSNTQIGSLRSAGNGSLFSLSHTNYMTWAKLGLVSFLVWQDEGFMARFGFEKTDVPHTAAQLFHIIVERSEAWLR